MEPSVSHDREQESALAKARCFQSLSLEERMEYLCAVTDLILENNPGIVDASRHAPARATRVQVLALPAG